MSDKLEGRLWSWVRSVMSQGADIRCDYDQGVHKGYEAYSARLDAAAAERAEEFIASEIAALRKRAEEAEAEVARLKDGAERWRELVTAYAIECGELSKGLQADDPMWDVLRMLGERFAAIDAARKETT